MNCEALQLDHEGWSNPRLPVLVYRAALATRGGVDDPATHFEAIFNKHGWPAQWRNGVYEFHHYHSNAHEVLGVAGGSARLRLGGPEGEDVGVAAGDAVLLPAGTGHVLVQADPGFLVVGAYPPDQQNFDICRAPASAKIAFQMAHLAFPAKDPMDGIDGPLSQFWRRQPLP
ncbi:MAG TPA: cupin domain-containing protein [Acidocella sp.]|jgi:uncharacterized protein YjlB|nr:cupin domain-containing protein [Acidocella sp.]